MPVKVLQVQMFGGFAMRYGNEAVTMNKIGSSKSVRLLQMLFCLWRAGLRRMNL